MISLPKRQSNYLLTVHYRNNLQLSENDILNNAINFLDFKLILNENNILNIDIYYMRNEFPFKVNLFTHCNSCLHKSVNVNILPNITHKSIIFVQINLKLKSKTSFYQLAINCRYLSLLIK